MIFSITASHFGGLGGLGILWSPTAASILSLNVTATLLHVHCHWAICLSGAAERIRGRHRQQEATARQSNVEVIPGYFPQVCTCQPIRLDAIEVHHHGSDCIPASKHRVGYAAIPTRRNRPRPIPNCDFYGRTTTPVGLAGWVRTDCMLKGGVPGMLLGLGHGDTVLPLMVQVGALNTPTAM